MSKRKNRAAPAWGATFAADPKQEGAYLAVEIGDDILVAGRQYSWKELQIISDILDQEHPKEKDRLSGGWLREVSSPRA
jgi:hypothetical protein